MNKKEVLSLLVKSNSGALTRVVALFLRRGYNIDTMTMSDTNNLDTTKITMTVVGDESIIIHLIAQISKLEEVIHVYRVEQDNSVLRELVLVKLATSETNNSEFLNLIDKYRASIVEVGTNELILEVTGISDFVERFLNMAEKFEILELSRTGITSINK